MMIFQHKNLISIDFPLTLVNEMKYDINVIV